MILVTGGTGLLGSQLVWDLAQKGEHIRLLVRKTSDKKLLLGKFKSHEQLFNSIQFFEGDVTDFFSLEDAMQDVKQVYHCAALVSFNTADADRMLKVNADGTENVVNACLQKNIEKLCYVSSVATLGRKDSLELLDENVLWENNNKVSNYATSKYAAEREVWRGITEGLNAVIVNPSVILGAGNWKNDSSSLIKKVHDGLKFYTTGISGFVDVRDVSKCMIVLMNSTIYGERFIISSENLSYQELLKYMASALKVAAPSIQATPMLSGIAWRLEKLRSLLTGKPSLITRETTRSALQKFCYSNEKIKKQIGIDFIAVKDTVAFVSNEFLEQKIK
jgi:nucleoside-diphosphate-sugar epimerase